MLSSDSREPHPALPRRVGVLGLGVMGSGIAHAFLATGVDVIGVEMSPGSAARAHQMTNRMLQKSRDRAPSSEGSILATPGRLVVTTSRDDLASEALVIEALPENSGIKREALGFLDASMRPDAILASNTSSISIDLLARDLRYPARFIGMHFFNPVPLSTLVELVPGSATADDVTLRASGWCSSLGKTAITVRDSPGFATSRLGVLVGLEAMRMLEEGVAAAETIDRAMVLGYGYPMGPLRLTDLVGLDVRLAIALDLEQRLGVRFSPPSILIDKVRAGELGRKSGRGFFDWTD